jgi:hypothetical protein
MGFQIFLIGPFITGTVIFKTLLNKTGSHLEGSCSSLDSNLESGEEQYMYRECSFSESWNPSLKSYDKLLESGAPMGVPTTLFFM